MTQVVLRRECPSLSIKALDMIYSEKTLYLYREENDAWHLVKDHEEDVHFMNTIVTDFYYGDVVEDLEDKDGFKDHYISPYQLSSKKGKGIARHDPRLISAVKKLGEEANASYGSKFNIVDLPENATKYFIVQNYEFAYGEIQYQWETVITDVDGEGWIDLA